MKINIENENLTRNHGIEFIPQSQEVHLAADKAYIVCGWNFSAIGSDGTSVYRAKPVLWIALRRLHTHFTWPTYNYVDEKYYGRDLAQWYSMLKSWLYVWIDLAGYGQSSRKANGANSDPSHGEVRESVVVWLVNDMSGDDKTDRSNPPLDPSSLIGSGDGRTNRIKPPLNPSRLKTRICYNWDSEEYLPFGSKCHFAHGAAELRPYSGRLTKKIIKDTSVHNAKQGTGSSRTPKNVSATGASPRRFPITMPKCDEGPRRSKGPNKISKIYGDWIDDLSGSLHHS